MTSTQVKKPAGKPTGRKSGMRVKQPARKISAKSLQAVAKRHRQTRIIQLMQEKGFCEHGGESAEERELCLAIIAALLPPGIASGKSLSILAHDMYSVARFLVDDDCKRIGCLGKNNTESDPEGDIVILCARITECLWFIKRYGGWTASLEDRIESSVPSEHLSRFRKVLDSMLAEVIPEVMEEAA